MRRSNLWMRCMVLAAMLMSAASLQAEPVRERGWLGLGFTWQANEESVFLHVEKVAADGPAAKAGIRPFDLITGINGTSIPFTREIDLLEFLATLPVGEKVRFAVVRRGESLQVKLIVEKLPLAYREKVEKSRKHAKSKTGDGS